MKQLEPQQPLQLQQPPEQQRLLQLGEMKVRHGDSQKREDTRAEEGSGSREILCFPDF